jgi:heme-degrading monooxygenase HmoA
MKRNQSASLLLNEEQQQKEAVMPIVRLIHVKVATQACADAERVWKENCSPLMSKQPGCLSEKLLKCRDVPGEYISYSEWEDDKAIETYRRSKDHETIQQHARKLLGAQAVVKRYEVTG